MKPLPRFLCDGMLGDLCRYLRAAGYDTLYVNDDSADRELLNLCHGEGRYFLTLDQHIGMHKAAQGVALVLPRGDLDQLAAALGARLELDWISHAFTRCLIDNSPLLAANAGALHRIPLDARLSGKPVKYCPVCTRVYWQGKHYKRMHARLNLWQKQRVI